MKGWKLSRTFGFVVVERPAKINTDGSLSISSRQTLVNWVKSVVDLPQMRISK